MLARECEPGLVISLYGELFQIAGKPKYGYVWVIKENGMLDVINFTRATPFWRFKDLIEEIESGEREDCLQWFFIPKSWREINEW